MKGRITNTRLRRELPFLKIGMKVEINGEIGKIVGEDCHCNLMVDFDGVIKYRSTKVNIKYFDKNNNLIAEYK
jgi:hypothetical protein